MKKLLYIVFSLATLAGCDKNEVFNSPNDENGEVQFMAASPTRVTADGLNWKTSDRIGITNDGATSIKQYQIDNIETGEMSAVSGSDKFYTDEDNNVNYYAYYPYEQTPVNGVISVNVSTQSTAIEPLLWAKAENQSETSVSLQFAHQYVRLNFYLTAGGIDVTSLTGATARLVNANIEGIFNITTGILTTEKSGNITLNVIENDKSATISVYVLPQTNLNGNEKLIIEINSKVFETSISTKNWIAGNEYNYNVIVGNRT